MKQWLAWLAFFLATFSSALVGAQTVGGGQGGSPGPAANASNLNGCVYKADPFTAADGQQIGLRCAADGSVLTSGGLTGSQSNAAGGTTGPANVPTNSYTYYWTGAAWAQWTGAVTLGAGSAIVGKFGIDQTTPGTTNGVQTLTGSTTVATSATAANFKAQVGGLGADGAAISGNPVRIAGSDGTNTQDLCTDTTGVICSPKAGTADRTVTKTSVLATTSTTVCPTATTPVTTEIWFQTGSIGISLNGNALNTASWGTATTSPDIVLSNAGTLYTLPVAATNIITAYTGTAQGVTCIQTARQ